MDKARILVVDDQIEAFAALVMLLELNNFHVTKATSGQKALSILENEVPDLILLDVMMPGMDGFEVCTEIKKNPALQDIPIIFLTAMTDQASILKGFEVGAIDYVTKPPTVQEILARVKTHVELYRNQKVIQAHLEQEEAYRKQLESEITKRKHIEQELRKLNRAVQQAANSIIITDLQGEIEYVNPRFCEVSGFSRYEVIGQLPNVLVKSNYDEEEYAYLWETMQAGREWHGIRNDLKKTGEELWELVSISPIRDSENEITNYLIVQEDITALKHAEQQLYQVNHQLSVLNRIISSTSRSLDFSKVLNIICKEFVSVFDSDSCVLLEIDRSKKQAAIRATHPHSTLDRVQNNKVTISEFEPLQYIIENHIPVVFDTVSEEAEKHWGSMLPGFSKLQSGMMIPILMRGEIAFVIGIFDRDRDRFSREDISMMGEISHVIAQSIENSLLHKQVAQQNKYLSDEVEKRTDALNRMAHRLSAILGSLTESIILIDSRGRIETTNLEFNREFGYGIDELFREPIYRLFSDDGAPEMTNALDKVLTNKTTHTIQTSLRRKDGTFFDADVSLSPIPDSDGDVVCMCHNISSLKEAERLKSNFVSMVTHELRTPIATMSLIARQLNQYYDRMKEEMRLHKIQQLDVQAQTMAELLESVLDLSRFEARTPSNKKQVDVIMSSVVNTVVENLNPAFTKKNQSLNVLIDDHIPVVSGDPVEYTRIWQNLISNAIKYTDDNGEINVRLGTMQIANSESVTASSSLDLPLQERPINDGAYLIGQVSDNGRGIAPEYIKQLFVRFNRGWAENSNIPGTGLGLSLVKDLLEFYEGEIHVTSQLGEGTQFTFWIPIATEYVS